jgi:hypothetical protein
MCKNVGSKIVPENWAKCGINTGLERLNKFSIDSPVRWEHCGHPVPEMVSDTEHRQCPHQGEEPHNYPDDEDRWEAIDEEAKSLQLHQVPVSGSATPISLSDANLNTV